MEFSQLAVPSVYLLISFLAFPSQWLLMHLDPAPLSKNEHIAANVFLVLILITYTKSVFVDPGTIPKDWAGVGKGVDEKELGNRRKDGLGKSRKWCRKCDAAKPPRAHHCKECKRYVRFILSLAFTFLSHWGLDSYPILWRAPYTGGQRNLEEVQLDLAG
jgi:palmitoyltransferase